MHLTEILLASRIQKSAQAHKSTEDVGNPFKHLASTEKNPTTPNNQPNTTLTKKNPVWKVMPEVLHCDKLRSVFNCCFEATKMQFQHLDKYIFFLKITQFYSFICPQDFSVQDEHCQTETAYDKVWCAQFQPLYLQTVWCFVPVIRFEFLLHQVRSQIRLMILFPKVYNQHQMNQCLSSTYNLLFIKNSTSLRFLSCLEAFLIFLQDQ